MPAVGRNELPGVFVCTGRCGLGSEAVVDSVPDRLGSGTHLRPASANASHDQQRRLGWNARKLNACPHCQDPCTGSLYFPNPKVFAYARVAQKVVSQLCTEKSMCFMA